MSDITIEKLDKSAQAEWDFFVHSSPKGTLFHLTPWMDAVQQVFNHTPHAFLARQDGQIRGVLPMMKVSSRIFGNALVSVPYGVLGGIVADSQDVRRALVSKAEATARHLGVDHLEFRNPPVDQHGSEDIRQGDTGGQNMVANRTGEPATDGPAAADPGWVGKDLYVIFQKEILPTIEENLKAIPRKQRRMARLGSEKYELTSRIGGLEDLDTFYPIYARNVRDLGSPVFPQTFFQALMQKFPDAFILSVWKDGVMVAGVLTFLFRDMVMPFYGGGNREYMRFAINDFMYWELMQYGCREGYKFFDFGRSKRGTGAYDFKKHWGFEPQPLPYAYYLVKATTAPDVNPLNPKYQLMINTWKRLPLCITNWLGPKLIRGIP